ncbi:SGNH/GDSL hydrolase family protein [Microbispora triticiradicis]|uniref:SGNH/GDSL hydrolase family protein n=1 Tax=Microbispora triticiradicis TaxID=2200763 RepID=UPI001AD733F5|nr:SGNH/GDSL hydrolase family protein [Microbispora triticiradicis]
MRRTQVHAALAALAVTAALLPAAAQAATSATTSAASPPAGPETAGRRPGQAARGALATAHTAGRVEAAGRSVRYSWPGVYFEGRFRGTGVGIVLDDAVNDYDVQIDGATVATLVTPGRTTHWVRNLRNGVHAVRLVKRSESPWAVGEFGGFVAAPGGAILPRPADRRRQIEFIGDSYTAGYGNMSDTRDCPAPGQIDRTTNADVSFGALTARGLGADYQINAFSGRGVVRNYNGIEPGTDYRTYYDRALIGVPGDVWKNPGTWHPQLIVIGLGINDFSTAINPGEPWTPETLVAAYKSAYHGFIDKLRSRYGKQAVIVVSATYMSNTTAFADAARQIVQDRNRRGDDRVRYWYYDNTDLDYGGCDWHPSAHDHKIISQRLGDFIATLPLRW